MRVVLDSKILSLKLYINFLHSQCINTVGYKLRRNTNILFKLYKLNLSLCLQCICFLLCSNRKFWVSWLNGNIRVGSGKLGDNEFLAWQDPNPSTVVTVFMSTKNPGGEAEWHMPRSLGKHSATHLSTPGNCTRVVQLATILINVPLGHYQCPYPGALTVLII